MVNTVHSYIKGLLKPTTPPTPIPSNCLHLQTSLCIKCHHKNTELFFNKQKAYQGIHITILSQNCITRRPTNLIFTEFFVPISLGVSTAALLTLWYLCVAALCTVGC